MENPKLPTIDELLAGTAQFDEKFYVSNKNGGYTLKDDILKKVLAEAEFRWNNGGKEMYENQHNVNDTLLKKH
jgi:hypothetical protein